MVADYFVYILTNRKHRALYTGVTRDLRLRVSQHRLGIGSAFTRRYGVHKLVYYGVFLDPLSAITR